MKAKQELHAIESTIMGHQVEISVVLPPTK